MFVLVMFVSISAPVTRVSGNNLICPTVLIAPHAYLCTVYSTTVLQYYSTTVLQYSVQCTLECQRVIIVEYASALGIASWLVLSTPAAELVRPRVPVDLLLLCVARGDMSTVGGAASAAAMSKARPTKAMCVIPSLGCACPFANSQGHPGPGRGCCGLPSAQREPCMGSCLGGCGGPATLLCFGHSLPLLRRMRRERRKRARVGGEAAPAAQAALVALGVCSICCRPKDSGGRKRQLRPAVATYLVQDTARTPESLAQRP